MTLAEFKAELRAFLKRGTELDDRLDAFVRRGIQFIEQNYSLFYMEKTLAVSSTAGTDVITLTLPAGTRLKSLKGIRFSTTEGILNVNKIEFNSIERLSTYKGYFPSQFWVDGDGVVRFNGVPSQVLSGYAQVSLYSAYPSEGSSHWLIDNAEGLLLGAAALEAAEDQRNEQITPFAQNKFDRNIKVMLQADYEARYTGQDIQL